MHVCAMLRLKIHPTYLPGDAGDARKEEEDKNEQSADQHHQALCLLLLAPQGLAARDDLMHIDAAMGPMSARPCCAPATSRA